MFGFDKKYHDPQKLYKGIRILLVLNMENKRSAFFNRVVQMVCFPVSLMLAVLLFGSSFLYAQQAESDSDQFEKPGIVDSLPAFYKKLEQRMNYALSWLHGGHGSFAAWRLKARKKVMESLLAAPPASPFNSRVIAEQDRGSYVAKKIIFNVTGDSRVMALMLVPKSPGPHPAVLLLHDHGGKYDIGKEKVIEPFDEPAAKMASAQKWIEDYYGGRFIGDELAKRGYVCLSVDMLNWSDRGGAGDSGQGVVAANFFNLGASFAGLIAHEDMSAAQFLSMQPEVDPKCIAAMGLSVGGFRTWQLAALSKYITAGISVCWITTYKGIMSPGNNHTSTVGVFTMTHPGLAQYLDYPDVASIACPKPMMFISGSRDRLFPVESIKAAYDKMHRVWDSQNAGSKLVTTLYDAPHEFNLEMQSDAFAWLDKIFKK